MPILLDTCIAIHLRDETAEIADKIAGLSDTPFLSVVSRVELENGVAAEPRHSALRRAKLDVLLMTIETIHFTEEMVDRYHMIVAQHGFSRRKIIDRMIAATALTTGFPLVTTNTADFANIGGLELIVWPS